MANSNILANLVDSARRQFLDRVTARGRTDTRNLYTQFDYPNVIEFAEYYDRYNRGDLARRICEAYPNACWSEEPSVSDDMENQDTTAFEEAFLNLVKHTDLYAYLRRADILANIGHYSILLIGVRDGLELSQPMGTFGGDPEDVLYLTPFDERCAIIQSYEEDPTSERFGLPASYRLTTGGQTISQGASLKESKFEVHHSRVIHICEGNLSNEIIGAPRLEPIYNRIIDLEKIMGGAAETFWLNSRGGLQINVSEDTQPTDIEALKKQVDDYTGNMRRVLATKATDVNVLEHAVHSPKDHFDTIISQIAGTTGIPQRLLLGSERGELASSQDADNWANRVMERQRMFCVPRVLRPFIDRCIAHGLLPDPQTEDVNIEFPSLAQLSATERAEIASKQTAAMATYINADLAQLVPPKQFIEDVIGIEYREEELDEMVLRDVSSPTDDDDDDEPPIPNGDE